MGTGKVCRTTTMLPPTKFSLSSNPAETERRHRLLDIAASYDLQVRVLFLMTNNWESVITLNLQLNHSALRSESKVASVFRKVSSYTLQTSIVCLEREVKWLRKVFIEMTITANPESRCVF